MSMLKSKVLNTLDKIGRVNGTAPEKSQDPLDAIAHEFSIANIMRGYADKRYEAAKDMLAKSVNDDALEAACTSVAKTEVGETVLVGSGAYHQVNAQIRNGATYVDMAKLKVALMKKLGSLAADDLIAECTTRRAPTVTYIVTSETDDGN